MSTPADVDVIIPAYQATATLGETVRSVLEQSTPPVRIVVVDDGSTDDTAAVAASFGGRVTVVRQANAGQGAARQHGMAHATSPLLLFLDADDLLLPDAIAVLREALLTHPAASLAYGHAEAFGDGAASLSPLADYDGDAWPHLINGNFIRTPGCVLIRRDAVLAVGGWDADPRLRGHEDWDLFLRLAARSPFVRVGRDVLRYRVHAASFSGRRDRMDASFRRTLQKQWQRLKSDPTRRAAARRQFEHVRLKLGGDEWHAARRAVACGDLVDAVAHTANAVWLGVTGALAGGTRRVRRRAVR